MDVLDMVKQHLKDNGFDGLYNSDGECACKNGNIAPSCEDISTCEAGFFRDDFYRSDWEFCIGPKPKEPTNA